MNDIQKMSFEELVEEYKGLVCGVATKFAKSHTEFDEYYQICLIALHKAQTNYVTETAKFSTFAWTHMRNAVLDCIRKEKKNCSDSIEQINDEAEKLGYEQDFLGSLLVDDIKKIITQSEYELLWNRYVAGYKQIELAEMLGTNPTKIHNTLKKIISKLREQLPEYMEV